MTSSDQYHSYDRMPLKTPALVPGKECLRCVETHAPNHFDISFTNTKTGQQVTVWLDLCELCYFLYGLDKKTYDSVNERALIRHMSGGDQWKSWHGRK